MKFIDEKGRLFEKFNIIDLLIIFLVLGALVGVNYKMGFIKKVGSSQNAQKKAEVNLWVKKVSKFTADAIMIDDVVKELKSNSEIGKITAVEARPAEDIAPDAQGKWVKSTVPDQFDVFITMEATSVMPDGSIKLGSKDGKVGATLEIKGPRFQTTANVIGVK